MCHNIPYETAGLMKTARQISAGNSAEPVLQSATMAEVSTQHITREDNEILTKIADSKSFDQLIVYAKEDGFFVFVDDCWSNDNNDRAKEIALVGLSKNFLNLLMLANKQGYWWLLIDHGATYTEGLQEFVW